MTTSAFVLILSILVLGGGIAALGDRIGTRVGKARLSLFNLRPRQTAVLVTLLTGVTISASTLAILFSLSDQLRTGIFELEQIQKKLRVAREGLTQVTNQKDQVEGELTKTVEQKGQVEKELSQTKAEKNDAQKRLDATNKSLKVVIAKQAQTSRQVVVLTSDIRKLLTERQELIKQRNQVKAEIVQLKAQNTQLNTENTQLQSRNTQLNTENTQLQSRNTQLQSRNTELEKQLAEQTQQISTITQQIAEQTQKLTAQKQQIEEQKKQIATQEKERSFLQQEVATLEQYYQSYKDLRLLNVTLVRGQVLAAGIVRVVEPNAAPQAVDQLLVQANRRAIEANKLTVDNGSERVVQITKSQVEQLLKQIKDGQDYVVRILSAGNYVEGEKQVQVFADAVPNQLLIHASEVIGTTYELSSSLSETEIRQRIERLVVESQVLARRTGIISDQIQIGDGRITTLISFIEQLKKYNQSVELKAVVVEDTYTAGPLKINLVAMQNGKIIFST